MGFSGFVPGEHPPGFPPGLVRCADTIMGEVYFLRLDLPHNGSVWFWGRYEGRDSDGLARVADNLPNGAFFNRFVGEQAPPAA